MVADIRQKVTQFLLTTMSACLKIIAVRRCTSYLLTPPSTNSATSMCSNLMEVFMTSLFLSNVPHDCEDKELRSWIESRGFSVDSIRLVRDTVAAAWPAFGYVGLQDSNRESEAIEALNGRTLKGRALEVKKDWRKAQKQGR